MNERINQLATQAGCYQSRRTDPVDPRSDGWIISQEKLDKFAALIVADAANILDAHAWGLYEHDLPGAKVAENHAEMIKLELGNDDD
jgi:hypothetical protein